MKHPVIHPATVKENASDAILERKYSLQLALSLVLAHSAVFFSRKDWQPVCDATNFSKSTSTASQATTSQQVGAEGGGAGSSTTTVGAGGTSGGKANVSGQSNTVNITTDDAAVSEAAASDAAGAAVALGNQTDSVAEALGTASDQVALASINAGAADTTQDDTFGEAALQAAEDAQATSTTALETNSAEYAAGLSEDAANAQITANNALTGAQQPVSQGTIPLVSTESGSTVSSLGIWITIIVGVLGIAYYLRKGKV